MIADLAQIAREQNDRDHAAGLLPSRYVQDAGLLSQLAGILIAAASEGEGGGHAPSP
jgi:hypothetical protein